MSLTALAVRICAIQALRGATLAGTRVKDSALTPLDLTDHADAAPVITVATDEGALDARGRDLLNSDRTLELIVELACAASVTVPLDDGEGTEQHVVIPHTDGGLEAVLDIMGRQVDRAFLAGNEWSDLLRTFIDGFERVTLRRGAGSEKGVRFAAHQIVYSCKVMAEPPFAPVEPGSVWDRFLAALRGLGADTAGLADLIQAEIEAPDLVSWRKVETDLGLRDRGAIQIGIGPAIENPPLDEEPGPLETVVIQSEGASSVVVDEDMLDAAVPPEEGNA